MAELLDIDKTLDDTIADFYARATREFPQSAERLLVLNARDNRLHGQIDLQKAGFSSQEEMLNFIGQENHRNMEAMAGYKNGANSFASYYQDRGIGVIYFNGPYDQAFVEGPRADISTKNVSFILEHELGHLIVANGAYSAQPHETDVIFAENAADLFAVLRLAKTFGTKEGKDACLKLSFMRAHNMLQTGDGGHFTGFTLKALEKVIDRIDFDNLTGEQTERLSWRLAQEHAPQAAVVHGLKKKFEGATKVMSERFGLDRALEVIAGQALSKDADQFDVRFANILLMPYLQDKITYDGQTFKLRGAYWDNIRKQIDVAVNRLEQDGVLFGMPQKEQLLQRKPAAAPASIPA